MGQIEQVAIQKVILDAGPIIHLDELNSLHLLTDFKELLVPEAVWKEVENYRPSAIYTSNILFKKVQIQQKLYSSILFSVFNLYEGEREAISLCYLHPDAILLTDDAAARLAAKSLGLRAYGTIGILLRAVRRKQFTPYKVINVLEEIPEKSTLFIKKSLLKEIIQQVKKIYSLK